MASTVVTDQTAYCTTVCSPNCLRGDLRALIFEKFSARACPQTTLDKSQNVQMHSDSSLVIDNCVFYCMLDVLALPKFTNVCIYTVYNYHALQSLHGDVC